MDEKSPESDQHEIAVERLVLQPEHPDDEDEQTELRQDRKESPEVPITGIESPIPPGRVPLTVPEIGENAENQHCETRSDQDDFPGTEPNRLTTQGDIGCPQTQGNCTQPSQE
jgi:hypothetical protein